MTYEQNKAKFKELFDNYRKAQEIATEALNDIHTHLYDELKENIEDIACIGFILKCGEVNREKAKLAKMDKEYDKLYAQCKNNLTVLSAWFDIPMPQKTHTHHDINDEHPYKEKLHPTHSKETITTIRNQKQDIEIDL